MSGIAALNLRWAHALIDGMVSAGVGRAVISPGSRSTPLALACVRHPDIQTWVQIDERSAAFFALGLARADGRPTILIGTSGSAPAHWYPAVIEANYSAIPLLLLSADRPPELQACGANQTIDQTHLFGHQVRAFHPLLPPHDATELAQAHQLGIRAVADCHRPLPGPVHINIQLREPLVPDPLALPPPVARRAAAPYPRTAPGGDDLDRLVQTISGTPGIIVCGPEDYPHDFAAAVTGLAATLGAPILADPLSGLRCGPHAKTLTLAHYDAWLRRPGFSQHHCPHWVLRFGAFPVSKILADYLQHCPASHHYLVDTYARWRDPLHRTDRAIAADPTATCTALRTRRLESAPAPWLHDFQAVERATAELARHSACPEAQVIATCLHQLPDGSTIFSSNSLAIRDLDSFSGCTDKQIRFVANRGVSGIDGNLSTLCGLAAAAHPPGTVTLGLIGDLAFFHDISGLAMAGDRDVIIVVLNNDGGGIFRQLPQARLAEFEQLWLTPTHLEPQHAAHLYNLPYQRIDHLDDLPDALTSCLRQRGPHIIEVRIDAAASLAAHRAYWAECGDAGNAE